jgi:hypothetical protein
MIRIIPVAIVITIPIAVPVAVVVASPVRTAPAPAWSPGVPWIIKERIVVASPSITVVRSVERTVIAASIVRITIAKSKRPTIRITYSKIYITATTTIASGVVTVVVTKIGRRT